MTGTGVAASLTTLVTLGTAQPIRLGLHKRVQRILHRATDHTVQVTFDPLVINRDDIAQRTRCILCHGGSLLLAWLRLATSSSARFGAASPTQLCERFRTSSPANEDPALLLNPGEEALNEPAAHIALRVGGLLRLPGCRATSRCRLGTIAHQVFLLGFDYVEASPAQCSYLLEKLVKLAFQLRGVLSLCGGLEVRSETLQRFIHI